MFYYLAILTFQIVFNILKVFEIKFTYENQLQKLLINSVFITLVSLGSVFFSLDRLFQGDWLVIPFYVCGSVFGKYIAMTQFDNPRFKVFKFLSNNKKDE